MDALLLALSSSPAFWISASTVLGLVVGSFLNVLIYRLPVMLERGWEQQARDILEQESVETGEVFNLVKPASRCRSCGAPVRAWQNIPVMSYLLLRGRCSSCGAGISLRYPAIEALTGLMTGLAAWHFGFGLTAFAVFIFIWLLIAMTFIDLDHQLLPDDLTLALLWSGLLFSLSDAAFVTPQQAIVGAIVGYASLWLVFHGFRLLTGKEGMGYGDFKLFAALGAWLGWTQLPLVILLSAGAGSVIGGGMILLAGHDRARPISFGPFLAIAGIIALFLGDDILRWYLGLYPGR